MKKNYFMSVLVALAVVLSFSSCSVTSLTKSVKQLETEGVLLQNATITELKVGEKSSATITFEYSQFGKKPKIKTHNQANEIQLVTAMLLDKSGADVLIEPRTSLKTTKKPFKLISEVTVSGYPAKNDGFRSVQASDSTLIKANKLIRGEEVKQTNPTVKNVVVY